MFTDDQLLQFQNLGIIVIDDFLPLSRAQALSQYIDQLSAANQLKQARIGKAESQHINTEQRGDLIHWVDPQSNTEEVAHVYQALADLRMALNRNFYLGLRDFECHLTQYPTGTFYKRHVDRHQAGSSRRVSVVYYLSPHWQAGNGGELCIYTANQCHTVEPRFGRLALFLSELEHEVLPTHIIRKSLTGWMLNEEIVSFKHA